MREMLLGFGGVLLGALLLLSLYLLVTELFRSNSSCPKCCCGYTTHRVEWRAKNSGGGDLYGWYVWQDHLPHCEAARMVANYQAEGNFDWRLRCF